MNNSANKNHFTGSAIDRLPMKIKKHFIGAKLSWVDTTPLSGDMEEELLFSYDTNTCPTTDLLLKRLGVWDVSHAVNANFEWEVHMELMYETPNNKEKRGHVDHHWFTFRGPIFPMTERFKKERDSFYLMKNLEHDMVPVDHKNKGYYQSSRFTATVTGVF